jgi:hypothetical protein
MAKFEHIFTASDSFNLHIERVRGGFLALYRRTSGEGWDLLSSLPRYGVIDADVHNNREREYKIVSDELPTLCVITFADGKVEDVEIV